LHARQAAAGSVSGVIGAGASWLPWRLLRPPIASFETVENLIPEKAMSEYEIAQKAFSKNRERLKAERLAREAAGPPVTKTKPKAMGK
jgi:hypothetical protein